MLSRYRLFGERASDRRLAVQGGLKLPTGNPDALRGSGAADLSIGLGYTDVATLAFMNTTVSAHAGVLILGDGEVLGGLQGGLQKRTVPIGGLQMAVRFGQRFDLLAQLQGSGAYYDSMLATLGDPTLQLSLGANIRFPQSRWNWALGIVEDAFSDMMPDFALHMEIRKTIAP